MSFFKKELTGVVSTTKNHSFPRIRNHALGENPTLYTTWGNYNTIRLNLMWTRETLENSFKSR